MAYGKGWDFGWWEADWYASHYGKAKGRGRPKEAPPAPAPRAQEVPPAPAPRAKEVPPAPASRAKEVPSAPAPRAKDEVFEELRNLMAANPVLQLQYFDARVRQHLHALLGSGGRQRLKAALTMVHTCTMHKTKQDVKNWPAYLLTLLKKFDSDTANQEHLSERRREAEILKQKLEGKSVVPSSASTTPEKTKSDLVDDSDWSGLDGFDSRAIEATLDESDEEPEQPEWKLQAPRVTAPPPKPRPLESDFREPDFDFQANRSYSNYDNHGSYGGYSNSFFFSSGPSTFGEPRFAPVGTSSGSLQTFPASQKSQVVAR